MGKKKGFFNYFNDRIWNVRLEDRNFVMAFLIHQLRIVLIVIKSARENKLQQQAAALTFYTMLSVVPVVALVFAIAKGFGAQDLLEEQLRSSLTGHEEVIEQIMEFAGRMLESTQGGLIAGIGIAVLLWTVYSLLSNIEVSFNAIWNVGKGRTWIRKLTEYFSIMLLAPIVIILAGSVTVVITTQIENLVSQFGFLEQVGPFVFFLIKMIPYALIWLLFTGVYMIMPNTKVNLKSALVAGIIAGTSFQFVEWGYINFQVGVSRYNAIYGSFAALPLFMIWANISWLITLLGAQIAYANQFVTQIENEIDGKRLSISQRHVVAIMIVRRIVENFESGKDPLSPKELASELNIPFGVTMNALEALEHAHILGEVAMESDSVDGVVPLISTDQLTVAHIIRSLDTTGLKTLLQLDASQFDQFQKHYLKVRSAMNESSDNFLVRDIPTSTTNSDS
ncbi:MAG: YihY/virulence factor BrkB family protein [Flavobacteriales bacterium]|jgi:membrane protein|nr:YihY/virulence factor BrkB family protein [Flavobacteriales bacterium]NCG29188.1 YihY family inner membrane protein [Bacteroidota bacterium]MBT3963288.1 YihY/virulence factor BrkB family protein [Flavobacteriales bacterium]MBT4705889.1 YihY/virulence factor BrkB family protein [Flavobacteriales bacterium]MBT4931547.1 YihY/virulence factor BrkB family protein [Flavobacteriales bacterium]